jgi:hypothetical protein
MNEYAGGLTGGRRSGDHEDDGGAGDFRARALAIEAAGVHRRHEELLDLAVERDGLPRELAETVHDIAQEEGLAPAYALALVASAIGVIELVTPETSDDDSIQQAAPDWVLSADAAPTEIARERRLRTSFRRLRHYLEEAGGSADRAVERFLAEPDVGRVAY